MRDDPRAINARRQRIADLKQKQFVNDVAQTANDLQRDQPDLIRAEAIRVAEIMVRRAEAGTA